MIVLSHSYCIKYYKITFFIRKNIFACLFSVHNTISLSRHEQVCLMRLRFERYFSHDGRSISRNVASLNILVHDVINLLYYISYLLPLFNVFGGYFRFKFLQQRKSKSLGIFNVYGQCSLRFLLISTRP